MDFITEQVKTKFKDKDSFSGEELFDLYRQFEPDLKETTFRWRIYDLKKKKIIAQISRRLFTLAYKPIFKPEVDEIERKIYSKIEKQLPGIKQCIWSTKTVNEFMLHIPGRFLTILQVEKEAIEPVYAFLKEQNFRNVYIEPEEKEIERYLYDTETTIILQSIISKAPTQKNNKTSTTTIEKIIVDLYCDKQLFSAFQGNEFIHIVNNVYGRYSIDFTKLFSYARRRNKEKDLKEFFLDRTNIAKSILHD